jgi:hypothetical protein
MGAHCDNTFPLWHPVYAYIKKTSYNDAIQEYNYVEDKVFQCHSGLSLVKFLIKSTD